MSPSLPVVLFWSASALVGYAYAGYPMVARLRARWSPRPRQLDAATPKVSLIIAAFNEELTIVDKLENALALRYPPDLLEIIVAADGSSDRTAALVAGYADRGVRLLHAPDRLGKTAALNGAVAVATGSILVFSDANTDWRPDTLTLLVRNFADPSVGGVTGRKVVLAAGQRQATKGETAYWGYEARLKAWESTADSVVTADGEIFAMRRSLYDFPPREIVHDDMYLTVSLVRRGFRVVYEAEATSAEFASRTLADEFHLKVRYASAGYQIISSFPSFLLMPTRWFAVEFLSHKLLRWLAPVFLLLALGSGLASGIPIYQLLAATGLALLALALTAWRVRAVRAWPPAYFALYFVTMNLALLVGLVRSISRGQTTQWRKAAR